MAFENDLSDMADPKTIDRERDIKLVFDGADSTGTHRFEVYWHDQRIRFETTVHTERTVDETGIKTEKSDYFHTVSGVEIPDAFPEDHEVVCGVIEEALTEFGSAYSNRRVNNVDVKYVPKAFERGVLWFKPDPMQWA